MGGKVKCEYCGSYIDAGSNCPNCGAVLPVVRECGNADLHPFDRFAKVAFDYGIDIPKPLI